MCDLRGVALGPVNIHDRLFEWGSQLVRQLSHSGPSRSHRNYSYALRVEECNRKISRSASKSRRLGHPTTWRGGVWSLLFGGCTRSSLFMASVGRALRPVKASLVTNTIGCVSSARSTEQLPKLRVKIFFVRQSNVDAPAKLLVTDTTSKTHLSLRSLANDES